MSSYVYRHMRLGYFQDFTSTSSFIDSEVNRAFQGSTIQSGQQHHEIEFGIQMTSAIGRPEDEGDLEAGDVRTAELEEEVGERVEQAAGVRTEISRGI